MRGRALAAALFLAGCASAPRDPLGLPPLAPVVSRGDAQADEAASLFIDSCVAHITEAAALERWIHERGLRSVAPEVSAKVLRGLRGQVWSATSKTGEFFLIVVPISATMNQCSVWARRANVERLNQRFAQILLGIARPGLTVTTVLDRSNGGPDGTYRELVNYLVRDGDEIGWVFVASTSASEVAETQGRLMVAPGNGQRILKPGAPVKLVPADPR